MSQSNPKLPDISRTYDFEASNKARTTLSPYVRQIIDEENEDYMDMTPKNTPNRTFTDTTLSESKLLIPRSEKVMPTGAESATVHKSYETLFNEDDSYADMSGLKVKIPQQDISETNFQGRFKKNKMPQRYGIIRPTDEVGYRRVGRNEMTRTKSEKILPVGRLPPRLPSSQSSKNLSVFAEGGFSKNDEDDYDVLETKSRAESKPNSRSENSFRSEPESPISSERFSDKKMSRKLVSSKSFKQNVSSNRISTRKRAETVQIELERKREGRLRFATVGGDGLSPQGDKSKISVADFSRTKFISQSKSRLDAGTSLQYSGKTLGVQSRINKVRQNPMIGQDNLEDESESEPIIDCTKNFSSKSLKARTVVKGKVTESGTKLYQGNAAADDQNKTNKNNGLYRVQSVNDTKRSNCYESALDKRISKSFENFDINYIDSYQKGRNSQKTASVTSDTAISSEKNKTEVDSAIYKADAKTSQPSNISTLSKKEKAKLKKHQTLPPQSTTKQKRKGFWRWRFRFGKSKEKKEKKQEEVEGEFLSHPSIAKRRNTWSLRSYRKKSQKQTLKTDIANTLNFQKPENRESIIDATDVSPYAHQDMTLPTRQRKPDFSRASARFGRKKSYTMSPSRSGSRTEVSLLSSSTAQRDFETWSKSSQTSRDYRLRIGDDKLNSSVASSSRYLETNFDDEVLILPNAVNTSSPVKDAKSQKNLASTNRQPMMIDISQASSYDDDDDVENIKKELVVTQSSAKHRNATLKGKTLGKLFSKNDNNRKSSKDPIFQPLQDPAIFESYKLSSNGSSSLQPHNIHRKVAILNFQNYQMSQGLVIFSPPSIRNAFGSKNLNQQQLLEKKKLHSGKQSLSGGRNKSLDTDFNDRKIRSKSTSDLDDESDFNNSGWWKATKKLLRSTDIRK